MESFFRDVRFAWRQLVKSPGFSAIVILVLAAGIGATTATFSVVDALLLRPLPHRASERIIAVEGISPLGERQRLSPPDFRSLRDGATCFESLAAATSVAYNLLEGDTPTRIWSFQVTPNFFEVLDGKLVLGRTFAKGEGARGANRVAVIGHRFWQGTFGSDPNIVGRRINLSGELFTVIGVLARDYADGGFAELYTPSDYGDPAEGRDQRYLMSVGRLEAGVSVAAASAEVAAIAQRLSVEFPATNAGVGARVESRRALLMRDVGPMALTVLVAIAVLLLIACANVATLLLARGTARQTEIAVRAALGATPGRVVRQLLTESAVLALIAGALGLLLASWGVDFLAQGLAPNLSYARLAGVDARAFAFTAAVSLVTALGVGLIPAIEASRRDLQTSLKEGGARATASGRQGLARNALVVAEIALSLALCAGAGVLATRVRHLAGIDPGLDPHGVSVFMVELSDPRCKSPEAQQRFAEQGLATIRALPGVTSLAAVNNVPMSFGWSLGHHVETEGRPPWPVGGAPDVEVRYASPGYLTTLGIPLREGRFIEDRDQAASIPVAVVSETMARRFWPGESPIGKRIQKDEDPRRFEIVGVIGDVRNAGLDSEPGPEALFPLAQNPRGWLSFAVRSSGSPTALRTAVRAAMRDVDPQQPIADVRNGAWVFTTLDEMIAFTLAPFRFSAILLELAAAGALLLSAVGAFGVTAYSVGRRTHEIGIRIALGARPADVVRLVLKQSAALILLGAVIGVPCALFATRALGALVEGVRPADPGLLAAATALLVATTLLAGYLAARRATRVSPMLALRSD
jgi:predicted permease